MATILIEIGCRDRRCAGPRKSARTMGEKKPAIEVALDTVRGNELQLIDAIKV